MIRLIKSFHYAFSGIGICLAKEPNFRVHFAAVLLIMPAGFYFKISATEWLVLVLCIGFVLGMEMINTAVEQLCNFIHIGPSPVVRIIKDVAAGAVLVSAAAALTCGLIIFLPKIFSQ